MICEPKKHLIATVLTDLLLLCVIVLVIVYQGRQIKRFDQVIANQKVIQTQIRDAVEANRVNIASIRKTIDANRVDLISLIESHHQTDKAKP
jgi:hypothetical protein